MESGTDVKATLCICMQSHDLKSFAQTLKTSSLHTTLLIDQSGQNIFHDISCCMIRENELLDFLTVLTEHISSKYLGQSSSILLEMLNTQTSREKSTPLLLAIKHNRRVIFR
jgi:hypothetical protein